MIRTGAAVGLLGVLALFGYFLLSDSSQRTRTEKAKDAAVRVGDTLVDQGVAAAVRARLVSEFKHDARFLHVYHDDGRTLIYGLLPDALSPADLAAAARAVAGVEEVDVLVQPRPADVPAAPPAPSGGP
jgi:hypothetical protein